MEVIKKTRGVIKMTLFCIWTFFLVVVFFLLGLLHNRIKQFLLRLWHSGSLAILQIKTIQIGVPSVYPKTLFASNHVSYLDIPIIASKIKTAFVAKHEVKQMLVFGWLSSLQNTIFINRGKSRNIQFHLSELINRISKSKSLVLFPEGTSTDGADVLPFKSSLFAIIEFVKNIQIQPISLIYKDKKGKSLSRTKRDYYAFYKGIPFGKHFWDMCCQSGIQIYLKFHSPIKSSANINRKDIAKICYQKIRETVLAK